MSLKIVYFAWVKQTIGTGEETVSPPPDVATVGALIEWLRGRDAGHAEALAPDKVLRAAVNRKVADFGHPVRAGDEIALFPPFTGG